MHPLTKWTAAGHKKHYIPYGAMLHISMHLPRTILFIVEAKNAVWNQRTASLLSHVGCGVQTAIVKVSARPQTNFWMHSVLCVKELHRASHSILKT
jgi:hypothetical protein